MQLLTEYFEIQGRIFEYFGYQENWRVIPIDDARMYFWRVNEQTDEVKYARTEEELKTQTGFYYVNEIYRQRFLDKWVYRGAEYTMIAVDTHTDGNKFLQVFDNSKERK